MFSPRRRLLLWLLPHLLLLLFLGRGFHQGVNTSLYAILPQDRELGELNRAEELFSQNSSGMMTILVGAQDFESARAAAVGLAEQLEPIPGLRDISLGVDPETAGRFLDFLHSYRSRFLSPEQRLLLEEGKIQALSEQALMTLFSPVSAGGADSVDEDPFLLASSHLNSFLAGALKGSGAMSLRDGVLTREYGDRHWILISLRGESAGVETGSAPAGRILELREKILAADSELEILLSGGAFHSYRESVKSRREITLLSTVSTVFIILLLLAVFRSFTPLLLTSGAIVLGILSGLSVTMNLLGEIHIFTIVFGTSLIGITVDYAFHYFTEWSRREGTGEEVIRHVLPGIGVGLLTTLVGYGAFIFLDFPLLRQMALFSISGLVSTFLSVCCLFPLTPRAGEGVRRSSAAALDWSLALSRPLTRLPAGGRILLLLPCLLLMLWGLPGLRISSSLSDIYRMSSEMKDWEMRSAAILDHRSTGIHFMVEGDSLEEVLQREEAFRPLLDGMDEALGSYMALSRFLPSRARQEEDRRLSEELLYPGIPAQLEMLGLEPGPGLYTDPGLMTVDSLSSLPLKGLIGSMNIGSVGDRYYSALLLFDVRDPAALRAVAADSPGISLVDRVGETEAILGRLSSLMILIIVLSYLLIGAGLLFRYPAKQAVLIAGIPLCASVLTLSLLSVLGVPVNLFAIVGLILVPGMGSDYLILTFESGQRDSAVSLSVTMSFLTTLLAFGMLSFTSIASVFGLSVSLGLLFSYCLTQLVRASLEEGAAVAE